MADKIKYPKHYTSIELMDKFEKMDSKNQNKILKKALEYVIKNKAGTVQHAIISSMGYAYQDNGGYIKC